MRILAALLVALPLAASAQYEPVPEGGYGGRRSPWYIGFGVGGGNGNVKDFYGSTTFDGWHGGTNAPTNVFVNFKIGATLTPRLLLGFDGTAMRSQLVEGGVTTALQINNYDAVATYFPMGEGLFFRAGAGLSSYLWQRDTQTGSVGGYNFIVGAGYAFWLGQAFNLTVNVDYSAQSYGNPTLTYDADSSNFFALWVGFDWY